MLALKGVRGPVMDSQRREARKHVGPVFRPGIQAFTLSEPRRRRQNSPDQESGETTAILVQIRGFFIRLNGYLSPISVGPSGLGKIGVTSLPLPKDRGYMLYPLRGKRRSDLHILNPKM